MFVFDGDIILRMMTAIKLDDEACFQAGEVGNIGTDRHLSPEVTAVDRNILQGTPEALLRLGGIRAKLFCSLTSEAVDVRHDWFSVVVPPHPDLRSTLPLKGRVKARQSFRTAFTSASVGMKEAPS